MDEIRRQANVCDGVREREAEKIDSCLLLKVCESVRLLSAYTEKRYDKHMENAPI